MFIDYASAMLISSLDSQFVLRNACFTDVNAPLESAESALFRLRNSDLAETAPFSWRSELHGVVPGCGSRSSWDITPSHDASSSHEAPFHEDP